MVYSFDLKSGTDRFPMRLSIAMIAGIFGNRVAASMGVVAEATFASVGSPAGPAVERQKSYWNGRTGSVVTTRTYEDGKGKTSD